ncbi:hypothetical protein [Lignipirellula cremea]|uniref:Uncharacterized protein n=1 Tax=Lignipirellula cremea TaxID=2528010 RepID=A0A518DSC1_9BACT|nr:hypothetical protein [Lignipirellula cremea]QDU94742.1 hypothetical protein Pla8534_25480 [Lignipirellula cremea]
MYRIRHACFWCAAACSFALGCAPSFHAYRGRHVDCTSCPAATQPAPQYNPGERHSRVAERVRGLDIGPVPEYNEPVWRTARTNPTVLSPPASTR